LKASKAILTAVCALFFAQAAPTVASPIISANVNPSLKAPITLTAREASLSEVLRVLADRSGMNFVVGEGVTRERITIILNNTPLDEAINLLVRASGLSYEIIGNSILIAEPDKLREDVGLSAYVVELKYAKAEEVAQALSNLTTNIQVDRGSNKMIIYASPRVIMEVERIVNTLDRPHILVLLETRLIEVSADKMDQYGLKYDQLSFGTPGGIGTSIQVPENTVSNLFSMSGATRTPLEFNLIVDMMVRNGHGRVLMDSKLTTTNNREASLHIGEVIPYTIQSYNLAGGGGGANQQIEKENVGVMLTMTPHVNGDDQITLTLAPEVSNITGWKGAAQDIPVIRTRRTNTTVRVEDGQAVILAGLLSEEITTSTSKLPILGDIPVLGLLFRNTRNETRRTNLIIEVIPHIIHDPAEISRYMAMGAGSGPRRGPRPDGARRGGARGPERRGAHHEHRPSAQPAEQIVVQPAAAPAVEQYYEDASAAPAPALPAAQPSVEPASGTPNYQEAAPAAEAPVEAVAE
jgi:type II secretory pathway component GspD/PulD (secretin)